MCTSAMPQSRMTSIWWARSGRFRIGRIGFGDRSENGYIRAPFPAARITPTIRSSKPTFAGAAAGKLAMGFAADLAADQFAHHAHRIKGADLLAFLEGASRKADRHFGEA